MPTVSESKPPIASFEDILCGPNPARSSTISLRSGPIELLFECETAWVRHIRTAKREMVRAIYGALRDRDWRTVLPVLKNLSVVEHAGGGFTIRFTGECRQEEIHFVWQGLITGDARGEIRFEFDGEAQSEFLRNRIGLCVLFPIAQCAGESCVVEHSDGTRRQSAFPKLISRFQPFQDIRVIRQKVARDATLEVDFAGDIFEMEDQRNWTDASFKIYGTPLTRPFPVLVKQGETVRQIVTLKLIREGIDDWKDSADCERPSAPDDPATVAVNFEHLRSKPPLGLGVAGKCEPLNSSAGSRLEALRLDHLRVDCRLWEADWQRCLRQAGEQAEALHTGLHIALFLAGNDDAELREVCRTTAALRARVLLWLVFDRTGKSTPPGWVELARKKLSPFAPHAKFAAGTDAYFAELNRERPPADADWLPCCSINPQVHASDCLSLIENLAAQTDVVNTARSFSTQPLVISPVTLRPRGNPNATRATVSASEPLADPRQSSLFAAGWTLGSLAALTATHPVHSLTYYETIGPRGILAAGDSARAFPVYHVFAGFTELMQLAEARLADVGTSLHLAALAGVTQTGRAILWLANLTTESVNVRLKTNPRFRSVLIKTIDERTAAEALRQPEEWWREHEARASVDPEPIVNLPRYGLGRLEMKA